MQVIIALGIFVIMCFGGLFNLAFSRNSTPKIRRRDGHDND